MDLRALISSSPLTDDDKNHWYRLLPTLTDTQKERLSHILTTKIEVVKSIDLIQKALDIIAEAEAEEESSETPNYQQSNSPTVSVQEELKSTTDHSPANTSSINIQSLSEEELVKMKTETASKLEELRSELKKLSGEANQN